ncbi:MAG: hypothetical protein K2Q15_09000, partial [Burkholderiales bacterium]|nr:hypothetical protein [Burkholderiales bacterium]
MPVFMEISSKENKVEFIVADATLATDQIEVVINEISFPDDAKKILTQHSPAIKATVQSIANGHGAGKKVILQAVPLDYTHERYFEVLVRKNSDTQNGTASNAIAMATVLILRPDQAQMLYRLNINILKNTGNASFLFMEDTQCGQQQGKTILLAPGREMTLPQIKKDSIFSIGQAESIVIIANQC